MRYAQTGIHAIGAVGTCRGHTETADPDDPHFAVDCPVHEEHLVRTKDPLWAATPAEVPLTDKEQKAADAAKQTFNAVAAQSVASLATLLAGGGLNIAEAAGAVDPGGALQAASASSATTTAKRTTRARKTTAVKKTASSNAG
jgi:hypothetical protein